MLFYWFQVASKYTVSLLTSKNCKLDTALGAKRINNSNKHKNNATSYDSLLTPAKIKMNAKNNNSLISSSATSDCYYCIMHENKHDSHCLEVSDLSSLDKKFCLYDQQKLKFKSTISPSIGLLRKGNKNHLKYACLGKKLHLSAEEKNGRPKSSKSLSFLHKSNKIPLKHTCQGEKFCESAKLKNGRFRSAMSSSAVHESNKIAPYCAPASPRKLLCDIEHQASKLIKKCTTFNKNMCKKMIFPIGENIRSLGSQCPSKTVDKLSMMLTYIQNSFSSSSLFSAKFKKGINKLKSTFDVENYEYGEKNDGDRCSVLISNNVGSAKKNKKSYKKNKISPCQQLSNHQSMKTINRSKTARSYRNAVANDSSIIPSAMSEVHSSYSTVTSSPTPLQSGTNLLLSTDPELSMAPPLPPLKSLQPTSQPLANNISAAVCLDSIVKSDASEEKDQVTLRTSLSFTPTNGLVQTAIGDLPPTMDCIASCSIDDSKTVSNATSHEYFMYLTSHSKPSIPIGNALQACPTVTDNLTPCCKVPIFVECKQEPLDKDNYMDDISLFSWPLSVKTEEDSSSFLK